MELHPERGARVISEAGMATYLSLHYHIVFSTKNRENTIDARWLANVMRDLKKHSAGCVAISARDRSRGRKAMPRSQ